MENGKLVLEDRLYTDTHEWVKKVGENRYQIGITDYAQHELKDIVQVELPKVGRELKQFQKWGSIDSQKTTGDLISPICGKVIASNEKNFGEIGYIDDLSPTSIVIVCGGELYNLNKKPYETWLIEIETDDERQMEKFLTAKDYKKKIGA